MARRIAGLLSPKKRQARSAGYGTACQGVLENAKVHAAVTGIHPQLRHFLHRKAAVLGKDDSLSLSEFFAQLRHDRFLFL